MGVDDHILDINMSRAILHLVDPQPWVLVIKLDIMLCELETDKSPNESNDFFIQAQKPSPCGP